MYLASVMDNSTLCCFLKNHCRRQILSGLLCLFWVSSPFVTNFKVGPWTLSAFIYQVFESFWISYSVFISYLICFHLIVLCHFKCCVRILNIFHSYLNLSFYVVSVKLFSWFKCYVSYLFVVRIFNYVIFNSCRVILVSCLISYLCIVLYCTSISYFY